MKLKEFQAKEIFRKYGIATPEGQLVRSPGAVKDVARELGGAVVLKPQLRVKGRGKVGGIGFAGNPENAAELKAMGKITKPVVAYIAGRTAPKDKKVGHAGAIVSRGKGSIESKLESFERAGIPVASVPGEVVDLVKPFSDPG